MNSYLDLLKAHSKINLENQQYSIELLFLNNITINPIKEYIEYACSLDNIKTEIKFGDYDNIVQNAQEVDIKNKAVIVFWELSNCLNGLEYKIESLSTDQIKELEKKIQVELLMVFKALSKSPLVIMNRFSALPFTFLQTERGALERLADRLNSFCDQEASSAIKWVNIDKCLVHSGIEQSIDFKGYLKNKVLYKHAFYWSYVQLIQPYFRAFTGQIRKLLALDCDNTLWNGILGEDGPEGITMDENSFKGQPYTSAQYRAISLGKKGVLLALASKNNAADVDAILIEHPDLVLKEDALVAKKVNWNPKTENLKELAKELNIGVDSFVFIDDSDFEVELMRNHLPSICTIQVPKNPVDYYLEQQTWPNYFVQLNTTEEDLKKLKQYKQNAERAKEEESFENFEDFLSSLELELIIHQNDPSILARMAQMSQKTNQFNLTTRRYTEAQIQEFISNDKYDCFAFGVKDKFGDSGISGMCIVEYLSEGKACIDTLLMSCRVLGRSIEFKFLENIISKIFERSDQIEAVYLPTKKNIQVADFYLKLGFELFKKSETTSRYSLKKNTFIPSNSYNYIKLIYA